MSIKHLAFLDLIQFEAGKAYRAAILLTQTNTAPIEFYLTDCVRPTNAQRILYGAILEGYIRNELFGKPLLAKLSNKPDVVVIQDPVFLEISKSSDCSFALISRSNGIQKVIAPASKSEENVLHELKRISRDYSILEPFERIKTAVNQVHQQEVSRRGNESSERAK